MAICSSCNGLSLLVRCLKPLCTSLRIMCDSAYSYIARWTTLVHNLYTVLASPIGR
jgi:hypothetical protein